MKLIEAKMSVPVMSWLDAQGYVPYAEVPHYGSCVDIVAMRESSSELIAVEMKTGLTKAVIGQAYLTQLFADYSYCAVFSKPRKISLEKCRDNGIGVLRVQGEIVELVIKAQKKTPWNVRSKQDFIERLRMRVPGGIAGKPMLKGEGPAQECARRVLAWRKKNPGATWRDVYASVDNHYSSMESMRGALTSRGLI